MAVEGAPEPSRKLVIPVNIANGQTLSDSVDMQNFTLVGIYIPGALTSTTMTFQAGNPAAKDKDKADYFSLNDSAGAAVSVTVASQRFVAFAQAIAELFKGVQYLKVVAGSAEGAARTIYLVGAVKF